jgi:hypothetical protein
MPHETTYYAGSVRVRVIKHQVPWINSDWESLADLTRERLLPARLCLVSRGIHPESQNEEYNDECQHHCLAARRQ